ncbi:MAG: glutamate 5-kinase [Candidatus Cloacimonadota bacterium]|nr:MAG: glutamate 5-kinase [Candidatus Cloacimonadota bacterium]
MRIVLKVGTAVLTDGDKIAKERMLNLVTFINDLRKDNEVILVSSGAVAVGYTKVKMDKSELKNKQALAAIGQPMLMRMYEELFEIYGVVSSQVLVTAKNLNHERDVKRINNTINTLLEQGVIPIINENDATSTFELEVGDNDQLSAYVTMGVEADMLVLLSDIDGYYNCDPKKNDGAKLLKNVVTVSTDELMYNVEKGSEFSTGGIVTKLKAAKYLLEFSKPTFLGSGFDLTDIRSFLLDNKHIGGTLFK